MFSHLVSYFFDLHHTTKPNTHTHTHTRFSWYGYDTFVKKVRPIFYDALVLREGSARHTRRNRRRMSCTRG